MAGPSRKWGLRAGQYCNVCFPKGGGSMARGETKTSLKGMYAKQAAQHRARKGQRG